jgi:hypothetical protein
MATVLSYPLEYSHMQRHVRRHSMHVETTLFDVIKAVSDQVRPGEEHLVAPAVVRLLRVCGADFLSKAPAVHPKNLGRSGTVSVS